MNFHSQSAVLVAKEFNSDVNNGLSSDSLRLNANKYGYNVITKKKNRSMFSRICDAIKEPMLIILLFGFFITFGVNLGKQLKNGSGDFIECFGILFAVLLSVAITIIMEGSSERAFETLNKIYENVTVKVIRGGQIIVVDKKYLTVGDVILLESGDKIVADGRLIQSNSLFVDESSLTGESEASKKESDSVLGVGTPLAERVNMVFSGSFVTGGTGKMVVTSVGDQTEMGKIAGEISSKKEGVSPLQQKLTKLGKIVTMIGAFFALSILALSIVRLVKANQLTFNNVQELLISCIVLIIAAVPEGLPTIVAVSLALNMIKLAKENALIKKMTATETAGAISVICSDKTGTLTQNKMIVTSICTSVYCISPKKLNYLPLIQNFVINNTAEIIKKNNKVIYRGSGTECALLKACESTDKSIDYKNLRQLNVPVYSMPFSSEKKCMITVIGNKSEYTTLIKGSPEKVLSLCALTEGQKQTIIQNIISHEQKAERILCFAHYVGTEYAKDDNHLVGKYVYDGFVAMKDPVRPEVKKAINECKRASIKVKILTGDNMITALAVARELGIANDQKSVINASEIENLTDEQLKKVLPKISVIARSTPIIKLRVVKLLKSMGEVVAVTGDGINDAPAIKHADVGIAMGISGSDITKETADVVLLDDSFATVVKTVSFGRNIYKNLQRFIIFQLSVNVSALLFITACAFLGFPSPFNTLQLLWINIIMDGPPALTLGLEQATEKLMSNKPVKRKSSIINTKMMLKIVFNGLFISGIMVAQTLTNFLNVHLQEKGACLFTLFILFQLFNAFNSKEIGSQSIFKSIAKNKVMLWTFIGVFLLHVVIVCLFYSLFNVYPMRAIVWIKCIILASSIIAVSEVYKLIYRLVKRGKN